MGLKDVSNVRVTDAGVAVVWDAVAQLVARYNAEVTEMSQLFVERTTTAHQMNYLIASGGMMQESTEWSHPGAVKPYGQVSVAFEIRDARDQTAWNDVALAYATIEQVQAVVDNVFLRHQGWVRYHMMKALFSNTARTFVDPFYGSLTVKGLANGDTDVYPPVLGSQNNTTDNHYLAFNQAAIADGAANPLPIIYEELAEHYGNVDVVVLANSAEAAKIKALSSFVDVADPNLVVNQGTVARAPGLAVPGKMVGYADNCWISEWRNVPAGYLVAVSPDIAAPLIKRIDEVEVGGRGVLELIATQLEFPFIESFFRDRHGYGVGNRLNGVVLQMNTATYSVPAAFA
jgi:hypothetical protein